MTSSARPDLGNHDYDRELRQRNLSWLDPQDKDLLFKEGIPNF
jgi:hypothetical protein